MGSPYSSPAAFDRALKRAVKASGMEPGAAYRQALRDRFLCRVFTKGDGKFTLKGGSGMLARIPDARSTGDLDFSASRRIPADEALEEMLELASIDLGDWCRFELTKSEESLDENGYSRLLKLRFATFVGAEEKDPVLIDLSLDCTTTMPPERVVPANRIEMDGITACDYLVYPLADQLADKLCAIMELQPGGWPSSRMKDLVDVVTYATHERFVLRQLSYAIEVECAKRGMQVPRAFKAPDSWRRQFGAYARKNGVPRVLADFDAASSLASGFFNPALDALAGSTFEDAVWDCEKTEWVRVVL